jgi:CheY-like chemotaxis protein
MPLSSTIRSADRSTAIYEITSANELAGLLQTCSQAQFTGQLSLSIQDTQMPPYKVLFHLGCLVDATGGVLPIRRWFRQLSRYCPHLITSSSHFDSQLVQEWAYPTLMALVKRGQIASAQIVPLVEQIIQEVLFDVIQLQQHRHIFARLTYQPDQRSQDIDASPAVAPLVNIRVERALQQVGLAWASWQQAGLGDWSPNLAPVIWDADELRRQTSLLAYHNLTTLVDGDRTLRDLAIKLNQQIAPLTQSLVPYIRQGIMGLVEVRDVCLDPTVIRAAIDSVSVQASSPLVAYVDDSRFDSVVMGQILARAGYRFINIRDPVQALPILLEKKPDLIFLDLLMPVTNGYEVCAQIRRISAFKEIPVIIITSSDGIVDRVRAKLVGSSGFLSKPIEPETVLTVLQSYLPLSCIRV